MHAGSFPNSVGNLMGSDIYSIDHQDTKYMLWNFLKAYIKNYCIEIRG